MPTQQLSASTPKPDAARRTLLASLIGLITAGIAAVLSVTIGRFALAPAFSKTTNDQWIELGALSALPENQLLRKNIVVTQVAGWGHFRATRLLWILRQGESLTIFSGICPHLGCTVNAKEQSLLCACHGSKWNTEGRLLEGPAPRALDALAYKVESGIVKVKYQDFKPGLATKEVQS